MFPLSCFCIAAMAYRGMEWSTITLAGHLLQTLLPALKVSEAWQGFCHALHELQNVQRDR